MEIQTLRDALIAKNGGHAGRHYRSRKITALSPGMQAQAEQLAAAASGLSSLDAAFRLDECGELDPWGGNKACGIAACPRCFMNYRRKETAISIRKRFPGVPNERLAFVTILLEPTQKLSNVLPLFDAEKRRMRNMADRKCREDDRWGDVQWVTWLEADRMSVSDLEDAGRNTRVYFENAAIYPVLDATRTIWRPHIHGIVELGDLTAKEFADTLRVYGHVTPYQVDVKPFDVSRPVEENLRDTTRYCLKFRIEEGFKGKPAEPDGEPSDKANAGRNWWCRADIEAFVGWLATCRGFQKLRFSRKKRVKSSGNISSSSSETELRSDVKENTGNKIVSDDVMDRYEYLIQDTNWLSHPAEDRDLVDRRDDQVAAGYQVARATHVIVPRPNDPACHVDDVHSRQGEGGAAGLTGGMMPRQYGATCRHLPFAVGMARTASGGCHPRR
ncbi:hypothetical protein VQ042_24005 [Aurantimonas sp. A2-1-M11]|uniref:hypothetical protein n=1 Tax=Aurantimonas sp. A2-1-M11 TaxID=3113712 RepID=UPI002F9483A7